MGKRSCTDLVCKQFGESCKGWQLTDRMYCRQCDNTFSPKNIKISPRGRNICPCCGGFLRGSSRSADSKRRKTELQELKFASRL